MTGHRKSQPRRDMDRAERMRARIAGAENEFQAMGHAFDWFRMELQHLERCGKGRARTQRHTGQASAIARQTMRELVARTESIIEESDAL
jgi:hypothetical protein